ncbi:MAG: hypothetical protein QNJ46_21140, partial [Leptolyngbyaceae cyanobacterium MO_188.B28]|nr:hypothetical protein [Leptolyngbyaceae cyanobacterium MO_188.B28]
MTPPPPSALLSAPDAKTTPKETATTLTPVKEKKSKGSCGCSSNSSTPQELDEKMRARIEKHPCYSEEAHHHYARIFSSNSWGVELLELQPQLPLD